MRYSLFVLCFFFYNIVSVYGNSLHGLVKDQKTSEPLAGATLYIKGRETEGVSSDFEGKFELKHVPSGKVTLVCSYISYETRTVVIDVPKEGSINLNLQLVSIVKELKGVTVRGSSLSTDAIVRKIEKLSPNIINIVGSKSIETSPDINVGEVLGRMSGVIVEKSSSGEAEYAVLRGMDKRYNITLVNGVKVSSPNNSQRYIPLNIFPSELLNRLEVTKNRTAQVEGDATGGAVNMVMKEAPNSFMLHANISTGYNSVFFNHSFESYDHNSVLQTNPYEQFGSDYLADIDDFGQMIATKEGQAKPNMVAGMAFGNRYLDDRLGIIIAANYQSLRKGIQKAYFSNDVTQSDSITRIKEYHDRFYSESQQQYGIHAMLDFQLSPKSKLSWYNFYVASDIYQVRNSTSIDYELYYDPAKGNYDYSYQTRIQTTHQQILATMLDGEHQLNDKLDLNWKALYSQAGQQRPDEIHVNIDNLIQDSIEHIKLDGDGSERQWEHNSDHEISLVVDLDYLLPLGSALWKFQSGGLMRNKWRDNQSVTYTFKPVDLNQSFESLDEINWTVKTAQGSVGPLTYAASELVGAAYLQANYEKESWKLISGIRIEYTDQGYHMFHSKAGESADGNQRYLDILPNIQAKYTPQENMNWRLSYYRSINRPGFFELVPYTIEGEDYTEYGNKNLKRTRIDNLDLRWEVYPTPVNQLLIGLFFKQIYSPIEEAYSSVNQRQSGYQLQNLGDARNIGLEIDAIRFIGILGVKANYTYTHSAITTPKVYYGRDENGDIKTLTTNQTRPLVNQAAHIANLSLICKDVEKGWDGQVSATYIGDRILIASRYLNSDYWQKGAFTLDASFEKTFKNGWSLFAKASNLLNTPSILYQKVHNPANDNYALQDASSGETLIRKSYTYTTFLTGISYKF